MGVGAFGAVSVTRSRVSDRTFYASVDTERRDGPRNGVRVIRETTRVEIARAYGFVVSIKKKKRPTCFEIGQRARVRCHLVSCSSAFAFLFCANGRCCPPDSSTRPRRCSSKRENARNDEPQKTNMTRRTTGGDAYRKQCTLTRVHANRPVYEARARDNGVDIVRDEGRRRRRRTGFFYFRRVDGTAGGKSGPLFVFERRRSLLLYTHDTVDIVTNTT